MSSRAQKDILHCYPLIYLAWAVRFELTTLVLETSILPIKLCPYMVEEAGFEPAKAIANGFTVRPLWPLGYSSMMVPETGIEPV